MDLLTAILACSVYAQDDALVRAIAQSNSHGNEFAVIDAAALEDPSEPLTSEPRTVQAALARLEEVRSRDGKPLLGWMQLPPDWVTIFGRDLGQAFDPCVNISIGTAMLSAFDYECSVATASARDVLPHGRRSHRPRPTTPIHERRACVVRKYAQAIGMTDLTPVIQLELGHQRPADGNGIVDAPLFGSDHDTDWGADHVLCAPTRMGPGHHGTARADGGGLE